MISVLCCGCLRVLGRNNQPIGEKQFGTAGPVDLLELAYTLRNLKDQAAGFADRQSADVAARAAGWSTSDYDGTPNHRCPDCRHEQAAYETNRKGAYIEWQT